METSDKSLDRRLANGLHQFDYFRNIYSADVPYKVDGGGLDVWIRLVPNLDPAVPTFPTEKRAKMHLRVRSPGTRPYASRPNELETQRPVYSDRRNSFRRRDRNRSRSPTFRSNRRPRLCPAWLPDASSRAVYPASFANRGQTVAERARREHEAPGARFFRYLNPRPTSK